MTTVASELQSATAGGSEIVLRTSGLDVFYGSRHALHDVTLDIHRNQITAIIGPSGCGKSTFLAALNRMTDLIGNCRVTGTILLDDLNIHDPRVDVLSLRKRVGMIFQKPNPFPISIRKNITLALKEHGVKRADQREHIMQAVLTDVGLWDEVNDRLDRPATQLSGGQQQRLCIARALALQPEVILMDEPCSALDPIAGGVIEDLITSLREKLTVVIVTHHLQQAQRIADNAAMFWSDGGPGRLVEASSAIALFGNSQKAITRAYVSGKRG